jgi:hypothetical protein
MFNVYISCSVAGSVAGCCLLSLSSHHPSYPHSRPNAVFFFYIRALESRSPLSQVCVCVRASLFCLANALGFEELKPVVVFFLLCQFDQY